MYSTKSAIKILLDHKQSVKQSNSIAVLKIILLTVTTKF